MPAAEGRLTASELQRLEALGWGAVVKEALETPVAKERAQRDPYKAERTDADLDDGLDIRGDPVLPINQSVVQAGVTVPLPQE